MPWQDSHAVANGVVPRGRCNWLPSVWVQLFHAVALPGALAPFVAIQQEQK
jgi:hypothetical protein